MAPLDRPDDVARGPGSERPPPPGWARSPSSLRSKGSALFPHPRGSGGAPRPAPPRGGTLLDALTYLEGPVRLTALLLVVAPLLDLALATYPLLPADAGWRLAVAASLPGALMMPAAGTLVLAVLAVARPGATATWTALSAAAVGVALGGFALGVLAHEVILVAGEGTAVGLDVLWPEAQALLTMAAHAGMGWGVLRHGGRPIPGAALPEPLPMGIHFLD